MEDKSIFELIAEYSVGTISPVDAELLRERLESDADAMRLFREIREGEKMLKSVQAHEKIDLQVSWKHLEDSLAIRPRKGRWLLWTIGSVVAASVALLLMFVFQFTRQAEQPETLVSQMGITPGGVKAVLQYEDGKTIDLTSSTSYRIVTSDGLVLVISYACSTRWGRVSFHVSGWNSGMGKFCLRSAFPELFFRGKKGDLRKRGGLFGGGS